MIRWFGRKLEAEERGEGRVVAGRLERQPKNDGRGIDAMPFGPPDSSVQFTRMTRMISPKPSVTIAR
jgi:hypothetical protein